MEYEIAFSAQLRYYARCSNVIFFAALEIHSYQACLCRTSRSSTNVYISASIEAPLDPPSLNCCLDSSLQNKPTERCSCSILAADKLLSPSPLKIYWYNILCCIIGWIVCSLIVDARDKDFVGGDSDLVKAQPMEVPPVL
jgi:hypothetical protein